MLRIISAIFISYIIGSIPTAYIFGRVIKGVDIRRFGSGNVGATNAMRVLGRGAGITVLVLDILKGFVAVVFLGGNSQIQNILAGLACVCGHNWTIFLKFKGGKGVAVTLGILIGLAVKIDALKIVLGMVILTWVLAFLIARIVSVASVVTGSLIPVYMVLFKQSKILVSCGILLAIFVVLRHKPNLIRVIQGKEPRLSFKKS